MSALEEPDADVDALVESIVDAGPEGSRTVLPEAQAAALVRRDVLEQSRDETAEALDVTVWTVDDRLRRARDNAGSAVAAVRALLEADAMPSDQQVDGIEADLEAVRNLLEDDVDEPDQDELADADADQDDEESERESRPILLLGGEPVPDDTTGLADDILEEIAATVERTLAADLNDLKDGVRLGTLILEGNEWAYNPADVDDDQVDEEPVDDEAAAWGRLMTLEAVHDVTRSNGAVSVELDDADTDDLAVVGEALRGLGYDLFDHSDLSGSLEVVRGRLEEADEDALSDIESEADDQADEEPVDDQDSDDESDDEDSLTCHYCGESFSVNEDDDPDLLVAWNDDPDERPVCGSCLADVAMGGSKEPLPEFVDEDGDDVDDVNETYACDGCGATFGSPGALGGHSRYCDERGN